MEDRRCSVYEAVEMRIVRRVTGLGDSGKADRDLRKAGSKHIYILYVFAGHDPHYVITACQSRKMDYT